MSSMAAKKKRIKLPKIEAFLVNACKNADASRDVYNRLLSERIAAFNLSLQEGNDVPQPTWKEVAILLQEQANLVYLIMDLQSQLEDPAVTHVLYLKKSIDELKAKLDDVGDRLKYHENNYVHTHTDPYY